MSGVGHGVPVMRQRITMSIAAGGQTAQVLKRTLTQGGTGASKPTWPTSGPEAPCRVHVRDTQPTEVAVGDQVRAVLQWTIVFAYPLPSGFTITPEDRLKVGTTVYHVTNTNQGKVFPVSVEAYCLKVG